MIIVYRDNGGLVSVETDEKYNIAFLGDMVYFSANDREYKIPVSSLVVIDIVRN